MNISNANGVHAVKQGLTRSLQSRASDVRRSGSPDRSLARQSPHVHLSSISLARVEEEASGRARLHVVFLFDFVGGVSRYMVGSSRGQASRGVPEKV